MERKLISNIVSDRLDSQAGSSDLADTLDKLAGQIDRETEKISGGLMLIGGAVACVNPLLGIGIATKGLLPSVGAKVAKAGADYMGNKLRVWNRSSEESKLRKETSKELKRIKPQIYANPILQSLEAIATNLGTEFDPFCDTRNWVDEFDSIRHYNVTQEAIHEVYRGIVNSIDLSTYQASHIQWIKSFLDE